MVAKASDALGMAPLKERIALDEEVSRTLFGLQGVPKVFIRNAVPVKEAKKAVDDYELTPAYRYELDKSGGVRIIQEPWVVEDKDGNPVHSLLPAAVAVSLIRQVVKVLDL